MSARHSFTTHCCKDCPPTFDCGTTGGETETVSTVWNVEGASVARTLVIESGLSTHASLNHSLS